MVFAKKDKSVDHAVQDTVEDTGMILPPIKSGDDFAKDPKVCCRGRDVDYVAGNAPQSSLFRKCSAAISWYYY